MNPEIEIKKLADDVIIPEYGTSGSAGLDLRAYLHSKGRLIVEAGETILIGTGLSIHIENPSYAGVILPRSGLGHKHGIVLGNLVGLIDSDYQGELKISCWNRGSESYCVSHGDRLAQLVIQRVEQVDLKVVEHFGESDRGTGGFGSTGVG